MTARNLIKVKWEFDIDTNEELQSRLLVTPTEVREILEDEEAESRLHTLCCGETGAPEFVDLDLFFDNPQEVSEDQVTDALSDEYGWLVKSWERYDV
jgi:hypothetical protein